MQKKHIIEHTLARGHTLSPQIVRCQQSMGEYQYDNVRLLIHLRKTKQKKTIRFDDR